MASLALTTFNTYVAGLPLTDVQKTRLVELGERFYVQVCKEEARHIRKHLRAAVLTAPQNMALATFLDGVVQRVLDADDRLVLEIASTITGVV